MAKRRKPLPVVTDCTDCGVCCEGLESPPGIFKSFAEDDIDGIDVAVQKPPPAAFIEAADWEHWRSMPESFREELRAYLRDRRARRAEMAGSVQSRPCVWLDVETRRCRIYAYRPQVCRDYQVGGPDCLEQRRRAGIAS